MPWSDHLRSGYIFRRIWYTFFHSHSFNCYRAFFIDYFFGIWSNESAERSKVQRMIRPSFRFCPLHTKLCRTTIIHIKTNWDFFVMCVQRIHANVNTWPKNGKPKTTNNRKHCFIVDSSKRNRYKTTSIEFIQEWNNRTFTHFWQISFEPNYHSWAATYVYVLEIIWQISRCHQPGWHYWVWTFISTSMSSRMN